MASFSIIEYKNSSNFSVIDQGFSYLSTALNNEAEMVLKYNEVTGNTLSKKDIDWSQTKVLFISTKFNQYQKTCINFADLPIYLFEIKKYGDQINFIEHFPTSKAILPNSNKVKAKYNKISLIDQVKKQTKVYTEDRFLDSPKYTDETKELYLDIREKISDLNDTQIKVTKEYIGFIATKNFCSISFQKNNLKLWVNLKIGELTDTKGIARDVSNIGHYGMGDYEIHVTPNSDLEYIMSLIQQAYMIKR